MSELLPQEGSLLLLIYLCPECKQKWRDVWNCTVNGQCPKCYKQDVTPLSSHEIEGSEDHIYYDLHPALEYWKVDEVIECLSLGHPYLWNTLAAKEQRRKVEEDLLAVMPDAYETSAHGSPEQREVPEPDGEPDRLLSLIWDKLKPGTQKIILAAYEKEHP